MNELEQMIGYEPLSVQKSLMESQGTPAYRSLALALNAAKSGNELETAEQLSQARTYSLEQGMIFPDIIAAEINTRATINSWRIVNQARERRSRLERNYSTLSGMRKTRKIKL